MTAVASGLDRGDAADAVERYRAVRNLTERLAAPLSAEDQTVQSMPDVSPTKWHRAHTTWFFEEFILAATPGYDRFDARYAYLFNSYYEAVGERYPRARRGHVSRPGIAEIAVYREAVDDAMVTLLADEQPPAVDGLVTLGLHHEQQHQELLLMDIKHVLSASPLRPSYDELALPPPGSAPPHAWHPHPGGLVEIGASGDAFSFDNEAPRHLEHLGPFEIGTRAITNGEWRSFMDDGGYCRPELWLSDGWAAAQALGWDAPLYWLDEGDGWSQFTLGGSRPVHDAEPVCHVSYYEADAFARWAGARLPTEAEWEAVAGGVAAGDDRTLDLAVLHPRPAHQRNLGQLFGDVWEWTSSAYSPYPGFRTAPGAVGEYNGKFMVNQQVLRGGCCVTPPGHIRLSYRNFFPPGARWAFSGVRIARDAA